MTETQPVRFEERDGMLLAGVRRYHSFAASEAGIEAQWREFTSSGAGVESAQELFGVICGHDARGFEYLAAVRVDSLETAVEGSGRMRVPPQLYAVFRHRGPPATLRATWDGVFGWLSSGAYESSETPDFECYTGSGPRVDRPEIEVWVGVRAR